MLLPLLGALALALGPGAPPDQPHHAPPAAAAPETEEPRFRDVRLPTGVRLRVAEAGTEGAPAVILLHGYTDSWFSWSRVIPALAARHHVVAPDQRGHGASDRPARGYAMGDFAADVVALMDARGIRKATVVGHSMGSLVAQQVVRRAPDRVTRLVLVAGGTTARLQPVLDFRREVQKLVDPVPSAFARDFQQATVHRALPPEFMDRVVSESLRLPAAQWRQVLDGILAMRPLPPLAARVPTWVVWGDRDAFFPRREQEALLRLTRPATLTVYEGTGHAIQWEEPERFARDLLAFLDAPDAPAAAPVAAERSAAHHHAAPAAPTDSGRVPLYDGLGDLRHAVTTRVPLAQRYFDQGLRLTYAFNHPEAIRAFREAQRLDSACAMCAWGEALALGPNINGAMDSASAESAWRALGRARALAPRATAGERALIDALAARYQEAWAPPGSPARLARDSAYARAMGAAAARFPRDDDAQVLYAEALMDLSPWDYWRAGKEEGAFVAKPTTRPMLAALERVLARNPRHPGACHFFIHAVEAAHPQRAVPCAGRLASLMPAAGHLVHMPAHIYVRVGRYADAVESNVHALHADDAHLSDFAPDGAYRLAYHPHNHHFLWFAATMAGRRAQAMEAARRTAATTDTVLMRVPALSPLQHFLVTPLYAMVRFGDWAGVLAAPAPAADLPYPTGVWRYARSIALSATGRTDEAEAELAALVAARGAVGDIAVGINRADAVLDVAIAAARGELLARRGDRAAAVAELRRGVALEDALLYDEPPAWHLPLRLQLGAVLLDANRPADAARAYREDLRRHPENGWALRGLQQALAAEGRHDEARAVAARLQRAWRAADVPLRASRF
jgi:pimeloyl-ACP methyl ester carboxylesterase/tetratricopeptide (TPR) repeat protein